MASKTKSKDLSRRRFLESTLAGSAAMLAAPAVVTAKKTDAKPIVGEGERRYEVIDNWLRLPDKFTWQTTHNVAVDSAGLVYVIHEGKLDQSDHPSIFVFDPDGQYVRSFGQQFQGGGHGIEVHREGNEEFLYVASYKEIRSFAKLDLEGETVWHKYAPLEAGGYADGEDAKTRTDDPWGRDRFLPTNFAFHPDGGFYLADGYGSYRILRYDADGNYEGSFGSPGTEDGQFNLPHGVWIDDRRSEPTVVVADRVNARLQWFSLAGEHLKTLGGFLLPANIDVRDEVMLVPDLVGRVTLLDGDNQVIAHLGDDHERILADRGDNGNLDLRTNESQWQPGKFIHPHDACFDAEGNILVVEWVERGRVTKLRKLT